jgi:hypothetical protein
MAEIVYKTDCGENAWAHVIETATGWTVKLFDADAAEYLPNGRVYPKSKGFTVAAAKAYADYLAAPQPVSLKF